MRHKYLLLPVLLPLCAFSQSKITPDTMIFSDNPVNKNTIVRSFSNEFERLNQDNHFEERADYPTQVIRLSGSLENQQLDCDQVNKQIDETIVQNITPDKFTYNMYIICTYDPETNLATQFTIHSYFDPLDDNAIDFLKSYLSEYNGTDFLGTKLKIEPAKG